MASAFLAGLVSCLAASFAPPADGVAGADQDAYCCFTHPRFSGVCVVQPGPEETCASILAYLNNPRSTGKVYCGSTEIRGGWRQVECSAEQAPASKLPTDAPARRSAVPPVVATAANLPAGGDVGSGCPRPPRSSRPGQ